MTNGILSELDFEKKIKEMQDRDLLEFVARQTWETASKCKEYDRDIEDLKNGNRKASRLNGGITGAVAGIVIGIITYFTNKGT